MVSLREPDVTDPSGVSLKHPGAWCQHHDWHGLDLQCPSTLETVTADHVETVTAQHLI